MLIGRDGQRPAGRCHPLGFLVHELCHPLAFREPLRPSPLVLAIETMPLRGFIGEIRTKQHHLPAVDAVLQSSAIRVSTIHDLRHARGTASNARWMR